MVKAREMYLRTFNNPEVKKSFLKLIFIQIIFFLALNLSLIYNFKSLEKNYIENKAGLIGSIIIDKPELKSELVKLSFKDPNNEALNIGRAVLKEYGYSESLEVKHIHGLSSVFYGIIRDFAVIVFIFTTILLIVKYIELEGIFIRIRSLAKASESMLEGDYNIAIYENSEGDFAKLAHRFKEMRTIIQNQIRDLNKEKEFLVNLLSDISHQLKTPLASLIIFNDILNKQNLTNENRIKFVENSRLQLNRMEWLIKSLLKLAKLDAGAIKFNIKENNVKETIGESIDILSNMAKKSNVKLKLECSDSELKYRYDNEWLSEAIINIIKNGIEHSKDGEISISTEETPVSFKIIISDNGEGISEKDLPNIFKRFYKASGGDSVGIGLSLSKSIIEAHNGFIEVISEVGKGTTFKIVLIKI
ncbi:hypothetical protein SAMN02745163_03977 [Clostridium cavendishii DSM 21758]|uniref:histidine kinase n=1 Tax=Clostridium cavendishii DSM 21758 TaxID=1121302 RepID=A0A1M6T7G7_9CLOT|nr:HAMP domain-containing sensor histidine kinase [Clostridium cavendishii]SHK52982.1 hypothetical protein SAMN02745163_03977 [Clostridium cavendishii DSM 21758]